MNALNVDLGPIMGDIGIWVCQQLIDFCKTKGDNDMKKKYMVCKEILEKYLEDKLDYLGQEKKYQFLNKFGPKKCPDQQQKRAQLRNLYSWYHYAPISWFNQIRKDDTEMKNIKDGNSGKLCT